MKSAINWIRNSLATACVILGVLVFTPVLTGSALADDDLSLVSSSALSGVTFDDKPMMLPVQRNFQMAMLTASSELGRTCGRMEAYGWRMSQTEQKRVNQIFNSTVDRMRLMNYTVTPQTISSISRDITLFTADSSSRHFIFLWSAGDLGLVMTLCETTPPIPAAARPMPIAPSVQVFNVPTDVVSSRLDANAHAQSAGGFTPLGKWEGNYICGQGYTGGMLELEHVSGPNFDGTFKFYPTTKNMDIPTGSYRIYGQYDQVTGRALFNPGKWISRPPHYYNTVMVGKFDEANDTLSATFQGISGCTSFEAHRVSAPHVEKTKKKSHKKSVKHTAKKVTKPAQNVGLAMPSTPAATVPAPVAVQPATPAKPPLPTVMPPVPSTGLAVEPAPAIPSLAPAPQVPAQAPVPVSPVAPAPSLAPQPQSSVAPTVPAQAPELPAEDKTSSGITVTAPAK